MDIERESLTGGGLSSCPVASSAGVEFLPTGASSSINTSSAAIRSSSISNPAHRHASLSRVARSLSIRSFHSSPGFTLGSLNPLKSSSSGSFRKSSSTNKLSLNPFNNNHSSNQKKDENSSDQNLMPSSEDKDVKRRRHHHHHHHHSGEGDVHSDSDDDLDKGFWAWIVVLGSFLTNGIIFGVINCYGILFKQIESNFAKDQPNAKFLTSCVGSLAIGMTFLCSFLASILTDTFGIRKTAVLGGILATSGMFASSFVSSLYHLYFTYGIMFGVGASLAYTPSLVILGHYFNKRLGIVNGVVTAGSSVFTMIISVSLEAIIKTNDFQANMRILAGLMSLLILCGLTFIEKKKKTHHQEKKSHPRAKLTSSSSSASSSASSQTGEDDPETSSTSSKNVGVGHEAVAPVASATGSSSSGYSEESCNSCRVTSSHSGDVKWFNRQIWKNQMYRLWVVAIPIALFGYFVPYVHLVNHVSIILPDVNGAILVTTIGASSGLGRIIFGNIADAPGVNRIFLQQIAFISIGILTLLVTVTHNMYLLMIICVGLGVFDGCFISVLGPIAFDLVGRSGASQAIGFLLAFCSIPLTVGPPIAGYLYDLTKSYSLAFLFAGIPPFLGAALMIPIMRRMRRDRRLLTSGPSCEEDVMDNDDDDDDIDDDEKTSSTIVKPQMTVIHTDNVVAKQKMMMMNNAGGDGNHHKDHHLHVDIFNDDMVDDGYGGDESGQNSIGSLNHHAVDPHDMMHDNSLNNSNHHEMMMTQSNNHHLNHNRMILNVNQLNNGGTDDSSCNPHMTIRGVKSPKSNPYSSSPTPSNITLSFAPAERFTPPPLLSLSSDGINPFDPLITLSTNESNLGFGDHNHN